MNNPGFHILIYDWLQPLLQRLRDKGLPVSPDTHLQVLKVFQFCGEKITDGESLFHYLSPVLAKNGEQVKILQAEIKDFLEEQFPHIEPPPPRLKPKPQWKKWIWAAAVVVPVIAVSLYFLLRDNQNAIYLKASADQINYKYPVDFGAQPTFSDLRDTQHIKFTWDFGDGTIDSSRFVVQHTYSKPGIYPVSVRIRSLNPKLKIAKADTTWQQSVCAPQAEITTQSTDIEVGQVVKFSLQYDSFYPPKPLNTWYVNRRAISHNSYTFTDSFPTAGLQQISFKEDSIAPGTEACHAKDIGLSVLVKSPQTLAVNLSGNTTLPEPDSHVRSSWLWLMALLIIIPAALAAYLKRRLAKKDRESKTKVNVIIEKFSGRGSPWEIPFKNHDELVEDEQGIAQLSKLYKRRSQAESYYLNIPQTISSTIRSEGLLQPVYSSASRPLEFLILIDKTKVKSQQVKLFEYLVSKFSRNDIYLEKFYFQATPEICTNANHPNGVHISRLHDLYAGHTLIIFGSGYQFLDPHYPALKDSLVRYFKKWTSRAICTPVSYADWNYREKLLQQAGAVFPADLKGQLLLFRVLEQSDLSQDDFKKYIDDAYVVKSWNFDNAEQIAAYLKNPFLYQWLCAMAVYPHIDWNVMVTIGDALQEKHFRTQAVNYSSLLRLVRMNWMVEGTWPDNLRLELLKDLEPAHEKTARETMVRILEEAALKIKPSSAVYENVQTQLIINKFLLHANDPGGAQAEQYALAAAQFKNLWEQEKIMDSTLAEYLRKPTGDEGWSTLIGNEELSGDAGESVTIDSYLKDGVHVLKKKFAPAQKGLLITSLFSASLLVLLLTLGSSFRDSGVDKFLKLTQSDNLVSVLFRISFNDCFDSSRIQADATQFVLQFPGGKEIILNADTLTRTEQIPYNWKDSLVFLTVISNNAEYNRDTIFTIAGNELSLGIAGCPPPVPSCNRWTADNENAAQFQTRYSGDWYELLVGPDGYTYEPFHIEPGYINGKKMVETYTCPNDENNFKVILDNEDGTFQVVYMRTGQSQDNLSFAFIDNRFPSRSAARSDATAPQPISRQRFGTNATGFSPYRFTKLDGRWKSDGGTQQTGEITIGTNNRITTMTTNNQELTITDADSARLSANLTWYKLTLKDAQQRSSTKYVLRLGESRMLLSDEIRAPRTGITRTTPSMGVFYPFDLIPLPSAYKPSSIDALPAALNEIWTVRDKGFLKIDLAGKYFYYSGQNSRTVSAFPITEVYSNTTARFKLVSSTRSGTRVMFIRYSSSMGSYFALCEKTYQTAQEVEALDENACGGFNYLYLNYPSSAQRIYVPVDGKTYADSEKNKFSKQLNPDDLINGTKTIDSIMVYINRTNTPDEDYTERFMLIKGNHPEINDVPGQWFRTQFTGGRFDRDYIIAYIRDVKPDAETELLSIVVRSDQFTPESEKIVTDIANNLLRDTNKKIRIEGIFYNVDQQKLIQVAIKNTTDLLYKNKVNRSYGQITENLVDRSKEQTLGASAPTLRIVGINYNDTPKKN